MSNKHILRTIASQANIIKIQPVPKNCFSQVLDHVTKVFLGNEPLVNTFPPCLTGARKQDFRKITEKVLQEKFSIMALDGTNVVGCSLNSQLTRDNVFCYVETAKNLYEDQAVNHIALLCKVVHKELDLFSKLNMDKMFEIGFLTVEPSHAGKGLATKLVQSSLELGAQHHFELAKADCTGLASAAACKKAGMEEIHKLFYDDYKINNRVVFKSTPNRGSHLTVVACKLQNCRPYVLPVFSTE